MAFDIWTIALLSDQNHLTSSYRRMAGRGKGKEKGKEGEIEGAEGSLLDQFTYWESSSAK